MAVFSGPKITDDGLSFSLDVSNIKSKGVFPSVRNHCAGEWIAMRSQSSVQWSTIYKDVKIIEVATDGTETVIHRTSRTSHESGTISITAGKRYYGTKPIHFIKSAEQDAIAPLSLALTQAACNITRGANGSFHFYAPYSDASVKVYTQSSGTYTFQQTLSITKNTVTNPTTNHGETYYVFISDVPVVITMATADSRDKSIIPPPDFYNYGRTLGTEQNVVPDSDGYGSGTVNGANVGYNVSYPVQIWGTADGGGNDNEFSLGLSNLSNTFTVRASSTGLKDFQIISPFSDTEVEVYHDSSGTWVKDATYDMPSGTLTSPGLIARDGAIGFDSGGSNFTGNAASAFANGALQWKFESNKNVSIVINHNTDEEQLLGWNRFDRVQSKKLARQTNRRLRSASKEFREFTIPETFTPSNLINSSQEGFYTFNGDGDHINVVSTPSIRHVDFTLSAWVNRDTASTRADYIMGDYQWGWLHFRIDTDNKLKFTVLDYVDSVYYTVSITGVQVLGANRWYHVAVVLDYQSSLTLYVDGKLEKTESETFGYGATSTGRGARYVGRSEHNSNGVDSRYFKGKIAQAKCYAGKALTADEILANFEASRDRFGV